MKEITIASHIYEMEQFDVSYVDSTVSISSGTFIIHDPTTGEIVNQTSFPDIQFEITVDNVFPVVYDLFFVEKTDGSYDYYLNRTVMGNGIFANYDGTLKAVHKFINIMIQPTETLDYCSVFEVMKLSFEPLKQN